MLFVIALWIKKSVDTTYINAMPPRVVDMAKRAYMVATSTSNILLHKFDYRGFNRVFNFSRSGN